MENYALEANTARNERDSRVLALTNEVNAHASDYRAEVNTLVSRAERAETGAKAFAQNQVSVHEAANADLRSRLANFEQQAAIHKATPVADMRAPSCHHARTGVGRTN